jgi:hypothetical protein
MDNSDTQAGKISLTRVKTVMNEVLLPIPRLWLLVTSVAIVVSLLEVTRTAEGAYTVSFRLTWVTVLLLALVWLPFLLKVLALSGGGLKALGGEASFVGLSDFLSQLSPEIERQVLPSLIAATKRTEETSTETDRERLQKLRKDLEARLATLLEIGAKYEELRSEEAPSRMRTIEFTQMIAEARERARDTDVTAEEARELFKQHSHGARFTVIALAQEKQNPELLPLVIEAIGHSESAFEQHEALQAAYLMLPKLSEGQKQQLVDVIRDQRSGGPNKYIVPENRDRWALSSRILDAIDGKSKDIS